MDTTGWWFIQPEPPKDFLDGFLPLSTSVVAHASHWRQQSSSEGTPQGWLPSILARGGSLVLGRFDSGGWQTGSDGGEGLSAGEGGRRKRFYMIEQDQGGTD